MILLEMAAAPGGRDPRVIIDGIDVTPRVSSVELIPGGVAIVHLFAEPQEVVPIGPFDTATGQKFYGLKRQAVQQQYRVV